MDDITAITQLQDHYFRGLDLERWEEFADCFVPRATGDYAGPTFDHPDTLVAFTHRKMETTRRIDSLPATKIEHGTAYDE